MSLASAWEIAIKEDLGRLSPPEPVEDAIQAYGFEAPEFHDARCLRERFHRPELIDRALQELDAGKAAKWCAEQA